MSISIPPSAESVALALEPSEHRTFQGAAALLMTILYDVMPSACHNPHITDLSQLLWQDRGEDDRERLYGLEMQINHIIARDSLGNFVVSIDRVGNVEYPGIPVDMWVPQILRNSDGLALALTISSC